MLGRLVEAANNADQPLRPERDGSASPRVSHQEHERLSVQDRIVGGHRHQQERHDQPLMTAKSKSVAVLAVLALVGCGPIAVNTATNSESAGGSSRWTDSVLATMTLREKAAQIVWPSLYGDYAS